MAEASWVKITSAAAQAQHKYVLEHIKFTLEMLESPVALMGRT